MLDTLACTARRCRLATALLPLAAACSSLTDVAAPDVVELSSLDNASGAEALRVGAISGFSLVYAGSTEGQIVTSGAITDEFFNTGSGVIAVAAADLRILPDPGASYPYLALHRSRLDARRAISALEQFAPARRAKIGEQFALAAFTELFLGENMCSGVPLGEIVGGNLTYGKPLGTDELFDRAIADFDSAVAYAADSARVLDMARVGRGRALLDRGRFADAAASVAPVATPYLYSLQYSATQPNGVFTIINTQRWITVSDREGGNGLDFRSARDPRVSTALVGKGLDGISDVYTFTRYASVTSPITLASGVEARLIAAEATLRGGDAPGALAILNALRQTVPGLAPLPLEATDAARIDQLFRERAFWLFATGHRHGDLRRLVRQYGRPSASVFPTGPYKNGQTYGDDVTFAPDASQRGNAGYTGCASRGA
jgi:starch-binding outer membrane protein, SusD/RagB family